MCLLDSPYSGRIDNLSLSLTDMYVQAKLQFQAVLDQVFPDYRGDFGESHFISLNLYVGLLLQYQEQIDALATEVDEYEVIKSIPCIGNKIVNISFITTYSKSEFILLTSRMNLIKTSRSAAQHAPPACFYQVTLYEYTLRLL